MIDCWNRSIENYDDYETAAEALIKYSLQTGNGKMLRAIKTIMIRADNLYEIAKPLLEADND